MSKLPKATLGEVEAFGAKWIPRLRLQDWDITFRVAKCENTHHIGECFAEFRRRSAIITIDPDVRARVADLPVGQGVRKGREVEQCVVHELFHVVEQPHMHWLRDEIWKDGKTEPKAWAMFQDYQETFIEAVSRVLLEADAAGAWGTA